MSLEMRTARVIAPLPSKKMPFAGSDSPSERYGVTSGQMTAQKKSKQGIMGV